MDLSFLEWLFLLLLLLLLPVAASAGDRLDCNPCWKVRQRLQIKACQRMERGAEFEERTAEKTTALFPSTIRSSAPVAASNVKRNNPTLHFPEY